MSDDSEHSARVVVHVPSHLEMGVYANQLAVWHTAHEFTLDFAQEDRPRMVDHEGQPLHEIDWHVVARIKIPGSVIFEMIKALNANMTLYEEKFGPIVGPSTMPDFPPES